MKENNNQVTVTVIPTLSSCGFSCGPGCGCGPSTKDPMEEVSQRLEEIREDFGNTVRIETLEYRTVSQLTHAADRLNWILKVSGKDIVVSPRNFFGLVSSVAPIIAVNNKIVSAGSVPTREQMLDHINAAFP